MTELRSLVTIDDLSDAEIEGLFPLADEMVDAAKRPQDICRGKVMASLFFEPSTRTRLSFEAAMHRLGGSVISVADAKATSVAKGESLADMAKVVGSYADLIVVRHPWEGAARVVSDYAGVPVINAGDGGHEHPTQTLCDLYTIRKERQTIRGLKIALWGDLKHGRTIHSLVYALARLGATILFRPGAGLGIPDYVVRKLTAEYGGEFHRVASEGYFPLDAAYIAPSKPHQLAMMPEVSVQVELEKGVDALYVTRLQKERMAPGAEIKGDYPVVDRKLLRGRAFKKTLVMHPLPRVDELAREVDADPRSMYFKQAAWGVPVRMALITFLLGLRKLNVARDGVSSRREYPVYRRGIGVRCGNRACVSVQETEAKYIRPEFRIVRQRPLLLRCAYCEQELAPEFIASTDWHDGTRESKVYHRADSQWAERIKPDNLIVFASRSDAEEQGFRPGRRVSTAGENQ